ncbi:MAG: thiol peroxidase [Gammaproteobacteria bacterium]|nr:thiol peroxidase [Gammaproteobacteria bacterium]
MANITLEVNPIHTNGDLPEISDDAPAVILVDKDLNDVGLDQYKSRKKLLNIVPSIDTGVCAASTIKFNEQAAGLSDSIVLVVSADLPFAQARFVQENNIEHVTMLSMMRNRNFAQDYGVLITDGPLAGIAARAVVVLDEKNRVLYTEMVPEISQEPDYESAMSALSKL